MAPESGWLYLYHDSTMYKIYKFVQSYFTFPSLSFLILEWRSELDLLNSVVREPNENISSTLCLAQSAQNMNFYYTKLLQL